MKRMLFAAIALLATTVLGTGCNKDPLIPTNVQMTKEFDNGNTVEVATGGEVVLNMTAPKDPSTEDILAFNKSLFTVTRLEDHNTVHWHLRALKPGKDDVTLTYVPQTYFTCTVIIK
jgi:predicted secreted protein